MSLVLEGRARRLGDDINTDYIISSSRKKATLDTAVLKRYLLEGVDPGLAASLRPDDLLVAGRNFGCGSAMEIAVTVLQAAGIRAVLAASFARSFFRNAINNGLLPIVCDTAAIAEGDRLELRIEAGVTVARNLSRAEEVRGDPLPPFLLEILTAGGLVPYLRERKKFG